MQRWVSRHRTLPAPAVAGGEDQVGGHGLGGAERGGVGKEEDSVATRKFCAELLVIPLPPKDEERPAHGSVEKLAQDFQEERCQQNFTSCPGEEESSGEFLVAWMGDAAAGGERTCGSARH